VTLTVEQTAAQIAALRRERASYVARGLAERVAEVDAQLELLGAPTVDPAAARRGALTRLRRAAAAVER